MKDEDGERDSTYDDVVHGQQKEPEEEEQGGEQNSTYDDVQLETYVNKVSLSGNCSEMLCN